MSCLYVPVTGLDDEHTVHAHIHNIRVTPKEVYHTTLGSEYNGSEEAETSGE